MLISLLHFWCPPIEKSIISLEIEKQIIKKNDTSNQSNKESQTEDHKLQNPLTHKLSV